MATLLVDYNMEGQAALLWDTLVTGGWLDMLSLDMVMFADIGLAPNSSDRIVWRFAQDHGMLLVTNNRSDNEDDSLEQTIREENMPTSLPVLTIGSVDRIRERQYRELCVERVLEIVLELDNYLGTGRLFIP